MEVALLNLANVLHRSHHSKEAVTALLVAMSHAPHTSVLLFTLGNVYAVSSLRCMGLTLSRVSYRGGGGGGNWDSPPPPPFL